jgi:uncharacterized protein (TIGR00369 family)
VNWEVAVPREAVTPTEKERSVTDIIDIELARQILRAQPFSRLIGASVAAFGGGEAVLEIPVRAELLQQNGFVHGGVLAYAADNALTLAAGSALGPSVLTAGFTISYLRPAQGPLLRARASVVHAGKRQAVSRCDVFVAAGDEETLCAVAQGTVMIVGH